MMCMCKVLCAALCLMDVEHHLPELQHRNKKNLDYTLVHFLLQNELIASSISISLFVVHTFQTNLYYYGLEIQYL
jgi:hypothetical protein